VSRRRVGFFVVLVLLAVDALVLASYWIPGMFGYIGSENYEWMGLGAALVGVPLGIMLISLLAMIWNASKSRSK